MISFNMNVEYIYQQSLHGDEIDYRHIKATKNKTKNVNIKFVDIMRGKVLMMTRIYPRF